MELDGAEHHYPDAAEFRQEVLRLKRDYPRTVITPRRYLDALNGESGCSAASIIVDSDGGLFYPCRTLDQKPVNLAEITLLDYVRSEAATRDRESMKTCSRQCGWYQYFAIDFFTAPSEILESLQPYRGATCCDLDPGSALNSRNMLPWKYPGLLMRAIYRDAIFRGDPTGGRIYLTFDDGPHPEVTPRLLGVLKSAGIRATFFVIYSRESWWGEILRLAASDGHAICLHGMKHRGAYLKSNPALHDELAELERHIEAQNAAPVTRRE